MSTFCSVINKFPWFEQFLNNFKKFCDFLRIFFPIIVTDDFYYQQQTRLILRDLLVVKIKFSFFY